MDDTLQPEGRPASNRLARLLADARQRLIQTGTRNRLVHTARFAKRGKSIDIVDERSDDIFRILLTESKRMRFDHDPSDEELADESEPLLISGPARHKGEERFTDNLLQTQFGQDKLQKKLLGLAREAKTLEEEQGINALYLALGFLRWYEDEKSETLREAPLVLMPVNLRRNERTSTFDLEASGEDIVTNESLRRRLADDFAIRLPDIEENDEWSPSDYFRTVDEAVSGQKRWSIDEDGMQLGFFSFAKLLMVKDLEPENWPEGSVLDHPILRGLLQDGFKEDALDFNETKKLDEIFKPADLIQVVDADSSQTLVIETVRKGRNLVVKGPPGTGKSQTITNVISSAVYDGKSVLFMAEKMAALNVVHTRLVKAGLQDICLELHSRSANKKAVLQELNRTLNSSATSSGATANAQELTDLRDRLNELSEVMHTPIGDTDITPYRAISTLVRLNESGFAPVDYVVPGIDKWSREKLDSALQAATALAAITERTGAKSMHPFLGVTRTDLLPMDIQRLETRLATMVSTIEGAGRTASAIAESIGIEESPSPQIVSTLSSVLGHIAELSEEAAPYAATLAFHGGLDKARNLADAGLAMAEISLGAQETFRPAALSATVNHLRQMLASGHSFFGRLGGQYRAGSAELLSLSETPLPKSQPERMQLLDKLVEWQEATKRFEDLNESGSELFGDQWRGVSTDFIAMSEAVHWISNLLKIAVNLNAVHAVGLRRHNPESLRLLRNKAITETDDVREGAMEIFQTLSLDVPAAFGVAAFENIPFDALVAKIRQWLENIGRLDEWSQLLSAYERLEPLVGHDLTDAISKGAVPATDIISTIRYVHAETLYRIFAAEKAWAARLTSEEKAELVGSFREREVRRRSEISRLIRGNHVSAIPRGGMGAMGFIRGEIARKRGHKPIRRLMTEAGAVVQQIKPVFLMSPISVAQYLPPGLLEFDLLVIDEASQVRPEDALGVIARAKQIVVVGDRQQLPPTSFFDRVVSDGDDEEEMDEEGTQQPHLTSATDLESVLTLCEARGLNARMLEWHYRSRHPSLIEVSNEHFYDGKLVLFPAPVSEKGVDGLISHPVKGAYDRGGKRNNTLEAEAIARAVAKHAREFSTRTLGVVTFSSAQRDQVTFWLDKLRQEDEALDVFMREGQDEEFFVKNIENVQGDERDVIYISVGYGPRVAGTRLDSMAFGPISTDGGERRLNVLFTRARFKTEVFVSFNSGDIDLSRTKSEGARVLKHFLQFAETGQIETPKPLDDDPDSDFEVSVARAIRTLGYEVDYQVGSTGFKIDLAVHDPDRKGQYMLAVECDGSTYHSSVWARERDRQRQEVLEALGWRFHRVWSTDWFHRRSDELRRLEQAIISAAKPTPVEPFPLPFETGEEVHFDADDGPETHKLELPDYSVADFAVPMRQEPHEVPVAQMKDIVERIVEIEGPVHQEEIARRVAAMFGKQKAGSRIVARVEDALRFLKTRNDEIQTDNGFWFTASQQKEPSLRNRSRAPQNLRKANMLPPLEIEAAICVVLNQNGALSREEIPRAVALLFGFQRTGPEFRPAVEPVVKSLLDSGGIIEGAAGVTLGALAGDLVVK